MIPISINKFEITLTKFLQEKNKLDLMEGQRIFAKSPLSLKRNIININSYLPTERQFFIEGNKVSSNITYSDYIEFVQNLKLNDYITSQSERISLMTVYSFLNPSLNMTKLYREIGMSLTTKKKDSKKLTDFLKDKQLDIKILPKKGITIIGEEGTYRILITSILASLLEIDPSENLINRKANNPLEKLIFNYFKTKAYEEIHDAKNILTAFIRENNLRMSYPSKKFLYIYICLCKYRKERGFLIEEEKVINLNIHNYHLLGHSSEDYFLNGLISSVDYTSNTSLPLDGRLKKTTDDFINEIQKNIITTYYSYNSLFEEIYCYLYKSIIRNKYIYFFYDNKLDDTNKKYTKLFTIVSKAIHLVEENHNITFTQSQISTFTLIFEKFIMKNKIIGRNSKRIVIVTNSVVEITGFFVETLRHYVDVTIVENININELHSLKDLNYDVIITFSNRIATSLEESNYSCMKLNFYLNQDDVQKLLNLGFSSSSRRKILTSAFLEEISNKSQDEIKELLLEKYSSHFL